MAPNGRTRKPVQNTKRLAIKAIVGFSSGEKKCLLKKKREHAVEVEVIPLNQRADRGGRDDPGQAQCARREALTGRFDGYRHARLPSVYSRCLTTRKPRKLQYGSKDGKLGLHARRSSNCAAPPLS